jgi:hypothetical protein
MRPGGHGYVTSSLLSVRAYNDQSELLGADTSGSEAATGLASFSSVKGPQCGHSTARSAGTGLASLQRRRTCESEAGLPVALKVHWPPSYDWK